MRHADAANRRDSVEAQGEEALFQARVKVTPACMYVCLYACMHVNTYASVSA